jgi:BirA family transcriptional regulator, biotin operon repressor / biotin---[acetyl-CoA-carboxylase] ligase
MIEPAPTVGLPGGCEEPLDRWEGRTISELAAEWGVSCLLVCRRVGSTNDLAYSMAQNGAPDRSCVLAEEQQAGRGREGRTWESRPGLGVWLSLVLRPGVVGDPGILPLLIGVAVARAIDPYCRPAIPQVKWPNDILVAGRKLAGILCEASWDRDRLAFFVAGLGINVHHLEADFAPELRSSAASLWLMAGRNPSRVEVAGAVVRAVCEALRTPVLDAETLAELERRDALLGKQITVSGGDGRSLQGVAAGISPEGSLLLRTDGGNVRSVRSGTVRLGARL